MKKKKTKRENPLYGPWAAMIQRCFNKNNGSYARYGGRGISVCSEWRLFDNFARDMKAGYKKGLSLDRIDNDGNYAKDYVPGQNPVHRCMGT